MAAPMAYGSCLSGIGPNPESWTYTTAAATQSFNMLCLAEGQTHAPIMIQDATIAAES